MTLRKRGYLSEGPVQRDNQGRDLAATKKHMDFLTKERRAGEGRSSKRYAEYKRAGWKDPKWTKVDGVLVLRSGKSRYVGVPVSGKKNSRKFDIIDLTKRELMAQLDSKDVVSWLFSAWKNEHGF